MILNNLALTLSANIIKLSCIVNTETSSNELWFKISGLPSSELENSNYNFALVGLLLPAMLEGENILVEGAISAKLFYYLNNDLQDILKIFEPSLHRIKIIATSLDKNKQLLKQRVATGFSAGVDSFSTIKLFSDENQQTQSLSITDLCTFNVGAMGRFENPDVDKLFTSYANRTSSFAIKKCFNNITIDSNLDSFYQFPLGFEKTNTFRNISAALCLEGYLGYYLYSSSFDIKDIKVSDSYNSAYMDPIILPMLSTENICFVSSGATLGRYTKTKLIACDEDARQLLDVCTKPAKNRLKQAKVNCSNCFKCQRTLLTLDSLGVLHKFSEVFDLNYYQKNKKRFFAATFLRSKQGSALDAELINEVKAIGFQIKVSILDIAKSMIFEFIFIIKAKFKQSYFFKKVYVYLRNYFK